MTVMNEYKGEAAEIGFTGPGRPEKVRLGPFAGSCRSAGS